MWYNNNRDGGALVIDSLLGICLFIFIAMAIDFVAEGFGNVYI
jgi:hypothetical protein